MRITLAYPYEGHAPDETIDLDDREARRLLSSGRARLPAPELDELATAYVSTIPPATRTRPTFDLEAALADPNADDAAIAKKATVAQLLEVLGPDVVLDAGVTKRQILAAIRAAQQTRAPEPENPADPPATEHTGDI